MTADLTRLEKVRMIFAEAGYPDAALTVLDDGTIGVIADAPQAVLWTVGDMVDSQSMACWTCWLDGATHTDPFGGCDCERHRCTRGDCSHPDLPRRPPRAFLTRPDRVLQ
jgi:hypothetical protein